MHIKLTKLTLGMMLVFLALVWIIPAQVASHDGLTIIDRLAVQQADDRLRFYNVDNSGKFTLLIELPDIGFRSAPPYLSYHRWDINSPSNIIISPDGQRFAFTAVRDLEPETTTLFIYTLGDSHWHEVPVPGLAALSWSPLAPNYDAIMLTNLPYGGERILNIDGIYLYTSLTNTVIPISHEPLYNLWPYGWHPNGHQIMSLRRGDDCEPPCIFSYDIYVTNLNGSTATRLTNLAPRLPVDIPDFGLDSCIPQRRHWSTINQRFYFALDCRIQGADLSSDIVYSVDLRGDTRLEINLLPDFYEDWYIWVDAIYPSAYSNDVYVLASGKSNDPNADYPGSTWHLYRITAAGQSELVSQDISSFNEITGTALSPDEKWLAITARQSGEYFVLVDLSTGEIVPQTHSQNTIYWLDWLDNEHLLYTEYAYGDHGSQPADTWILDITTGERTNITEGMDGLIWIIE